MCVCVCVCCTKVWLQYSDAQRTKEGRTCLGITVLLEPSKRIKKNEVSCHTAGVANKEGKRQIAVEWEEKQK